VHEEWRCKHVHQGTLKTRQTTIGPDVSSNFFTSLCVQQEEMLHRWKNLEVQDQGMHKKDDCISIVVNSVSKQNNK
jgi:hypothetical protein